MGPEAGRIEESGFDSLFFPQVSSSLLGGGARLDSAGLVHCSDWVYAFRQGMGQGILRRN